MTTRANRSLFFRKSFFYLTICTLLVTVLCMQQVQSTAAYITSLSSTCVNLFTGEENSDLPSEDTSSTPPTGDNSHIEWYIVVMLLSLVAIIILLSWGYKTVSSKKQNKWRTKQ